MYTKCEMYLDDCIVFPRGHEELLKRLERVFQRFRRFGLFLKAKKCRFGMKQIDYVGRQISNQGISMSKEKIEGVLKFPKPLTIHFWVWRTIFAASYRFIRTWSNLSKI